MEERCDYEDNTEPVMQTDPLLLAQGKHSPAVPVRNSSGRNKKSTIPVKVMPMKESAVNTETNDRQFNSVFVSPLIFLPFYLILSGT